MYLHFGVGSIQPNTVALAKWVGKRVRVHGIIYSAKARGREFDVLSDPLCVWPVQIEVYSVQRVTSDQRTANAS